MVSKGKFKPLHYLHGVLAILLSGALALPAMAQEANRDAPVAVSRVSLDEITVFARKKDESLQEVPGSVTALSSDALGRRQVQDIADIARLTPNLSLPKAFGRTTERPVIRGLGNVLAGVQFGVESGAAYFIDGNYYAGDLSSFNQDELERVEIIRGPQSALYGRNTYSGAINFITKGATDTLSSTVRGRIGEDRDQDLSAFISGPLIDDVLGAKLSMRYYSFDGEWRNRVTERTVGDEETKSASLVLEFDPTENLSLSWRSSYQEDRDGTRPFFFQPAESNNCFAGTRSNASFEITGSNNFNQYFCGEVTNPFPGTVALNDGPAVNIIPIPGLPLGTLASPIPGVFYPIPEIFIFNGDLYNSAPGQVFSGVNRDLFLSTLSGDWDIGNSGFTLSGAISLRDQDLKTGSDSDHSSVNLFFGDDTSEECVFFCASEKKAFEDYSVELRLNSPADNRWRWMAGLFYYDQDISTRDINFSFPNGSGIMDVDANEETVENKAIFFQVEYDVTDDISASFEGRYFKEEKTLAQWRDPAGPAPQGTQVFNERAEFDEFAPRVTVDWTPQEGTLFYANYAKGYKPGGLNGQDGLDVNTPSYEQEEADSFEVGVKKDWLDGSLRTNVALYWIDLKNIQLTTPLASGGTGTLTSIVTNQGDGESRGVEVEIDWQWTDNTRIGGNYSLADTEFTAGCDEFQWTLTSGGGVLQDAAACTGTNPNGMGNGSIEGNQFPLSSKNQFSAFVDYRRDLSSDMEFVSGATWSWEDEKPVQVHNLAFVPDAHNVDAFIGLSTESWDVRLYGRNLTDEDAPQMVTRWLQNPLIGGSNGNIFAGDPDSGFTPYNQANIDMVSNGLPNSDLAINFPRGFFGDLRRGRNYGLEFTVRFGGE